MVRNETKHVTYGPLLTEFAIAGPPFILDAFAIAGSPFIPTAFATAGVPSFETKFTIAGVPSFETAFTLLPLENPTCPRPVGVKSVLFIGIGTIGFIPGNGEKFGGSFGFTFGFGPEGGSIGLKIGIVLGFDVPGGIPGNGLEFEVGGIPGIPVFEVGGCIFGIDIGGSIE